MLGRLRREEQRRQRGMKARMALALLSGVIVVFMLYGTTARHSDEPRCQLEGYGTDIEALDLKDCKFVSLPASIARFRQLRRLDLGRNSLSTLPPLPSSLEVLFLLGNAFVTVPPQISDLPQLRMLSFKSCRLRSIDVPLPTSLKWLILTDNELMSLPAQLGELRLMRKLMLSNNQLSSLPRSMSQLEQLELLRLANNRLRRLPEWLFSLPVLTWLAVAGNPAVSAPPPRHSLEPVQLTDLTIQARLGEGTSGVVSRALWRGRTVAVKLYKQELSSDGRNIDELRASSAVEHSRIVKLLGYFEEPSLGAVLEWVEGFSALGRPPSLETITRDTYKDGLSFSLAFVSRAVCGVAAAAAHLHARGISHGDLYAHNILVRDTGEAKLGDFGAAFHYGDDAHHAAQFEKMEVRAFGHLVHELVERTRPSPVESELVSLMTSLADMCTGPMESRPTFDQIARRLLPIGGNC